MRRNGRGDAFDDELFERAEHPAAGVFPRRSPSHHLGDQTVVRPRDLIALAEPRVHADARASRLLIPRDAPGCRQETARGILGVDPALNGVPAGTEDPAGKHVTLFETERLASGDPQLGGHQVQAEYLLGDRVLDLEPGVDLQEIELPSVRVDKELDGSGVHVTAGVRHGGGRLAHSGNQVGQPRRRSLLYELLMTPLKRAVPGAEPERASRSLGQDLHLDVLGGRKVPFEVDVAVSEIGGGLSRGGLQCGRHVLGAVRHFETPSAASPRRLDRDRISAPITERDDLFGALDGLHRSRDRRHARGARQSPRLHLVAGQTQRLGRRSDPHQARIGEGFGGVGSFGEEPVPGVNGLRAGAPSRLHDCPDVQVGIGRRRPGEVDGVVGESDVAGARVRVREHCHGGYAQVAARAPHAHGDLSPIRDQHLGEHQLVAQRGPDFDTWLASGCPTSSSASSAASSNRSKSIPTSVPMSISM